MPYLGSKPTKGNFSDLNGGKLILDADADTSITADTDDQIDIEISGANDFKFSANAFNVLSGSTLTIDSGATIANSGTATGFSSADPSSADGDTLGTASAEWSDLYLADGGVIFFGNDQEVKVTHVADTGLTLKHTATADDKPISLTLQTGETDMAANDVMGKISFQAPDEGTGTDAILVAAAIQARAEGDFSSSSNATSLDFMTGSSEAAAKKWSITSAGSFLNAGTNTIDMNAGELILDADADTSITASTDDQIDIKIANADDFTFTANTFTALSGSGVVIPDSGLTLGSTAVTSTAAELNTLDALSRGSVLYGNASAVTTVLTKGTANQVLTSDGTDLSWAAAAGGIGTNFLRNPAMQINERETLGVYTSSTKHNNVDSAYILDGWHLVSDGNDRVDVSQESSVVPTSGDKAMKLDVETVSGTSEKFGIVQILESQYCSSAIGQTCTLSFKARPTSGTVENLRAHILSWDGTKDAPTRDIVSEWSDEGTNPTFVTNWTVENTASNIAIDNTYDTYSVSGAIDTSGTVNIAVFIHVDDTDLAAGNLLYITDVKLEIGSSATDFVYGSGAAGADRYWCKRYYEKFTSGSTNDPYFAGGWKGTSTLAYLMFYYQEKRVIPAIGFSTVTDYSITSADDENGASTGIIAPDPGFFGVRLTFTDSSGPFSTTYGAFIYIERHASEKWIEVSAEM